MTITEKVAYIKGLMEGLEIDKTTKEGKLFAAIIDTLDDLALTVADQGDQIDAVDEDLDALEEFVYEDLDPEFDDDYCTGDCDNCDGCDDFDYDPSEYEFECPQCHEVVFIDESAFEEGKEIECPSCGAKLQGFYEEDGDDGEDEPF